MTNKNAKISQKVLAVFMSLLMVISVIPFSTVAWAATDEHPDAVTVTVKDEDGNLIKDATVDFTVKSSTDSSKDIAKTETTDEYGVVEILAADKFVADDLMLNATVKADSYFDGEIKDQVVESVDANYEVVLETVEITGKSLSYDTTAQELVSANAKDTDKVEYAKASDSPSDFTLNDKGKPVATNVGTYKIDVTVTRDKKVITKTVITEISKAAIGITLTANENLVYNEADQQLVKVENLQIGDTVQWIVNGVVQESYVVDNNNINTVPTKINVGEYKISLTVNRGDNYTTYQSDELTVEIKSNFIDGLSAKLASNLVYNENEQELVEKNEKNEYVIGLSENDKVYYIVGTDKDAVMKSKDWQEWTDDSCPVGKDANSYTVRIKVKRATHNDTEVELNPATVTIAKADATVEFTSENKTEIEYVQTDLPSTIQYIAENKSLSDGSITYSVENNDDNDTREISDIAEIDSQTGELTIKDGGDIVIKATLSETNNYKKSVASRELGITTKEDPNNPYIKFEKSSIDYILGSNGGKCDINNALLQNKGRGEITYRIDDGYGLKISKSWNLSKATFDYYVEVNNYQTLLSKLSEGKTTVKIYATKAERPRQPEATTFYELNITCLETPENPLTIITEKSTEYWYNKQVEIKPTDTENYTIANEWNEKTHELIFDGSATFENQGTATRYVYLKNADGQITNAIPVNINIDTFKPETNNMSIEIQNLNVIEKLGYKFGFFNPEVDIKFTVVDETDKIESGMQKFTCYYTKDSNSVKSIASDKTYELTPELNDDSEYIATLTIKASELEAYRGNISFTATDNAGNTSDKVTDEDHIIVVDTISPEITADFKLVNADGNYNSVTTDGIKQHYYDGDVEFTFTVKEQNFFSEDVVINVTRDGKEYPVDVYWSTGADSDEVYYGKFTLSGDGDYVVTMSYQDQSKNVMMDENGSEVDLYTSEVITIDTTNPKVKIEYTHEGNIQKTKFTVTEHNFRASDVTVSGTMKDINENDIAFTADKLTNILRSAEWEQENNTYTFEYDGYIDGIYNLIMDYKDISKNDAEPYIADEFIIDHTAPNDVSIEIVTSPLNTILGAITFGFYNPDVEVKFTAYDNASGVKDFTWNYTKENGASNINRPTDEVPTTVDVVRDENDKSKFTATVTLPDTDAKELRGYLAVYATDNFENASEKITDDGNIIVVDHISPEISVEYSEASRTVGSKAYYNSDIDVTFNVTEANFYAEDVKVTVTKNGGIPYSVDDQISWSSRDENNLTVGKMTLPAPAEHSGDGHYIIHVEYIDKSNNEAVSYTSHELTIDTIKPVIDVTYNNTNVKNTLTDTEKHKRNYFDGTQTAVITIKEHNFVSNEVNFNIIAKDVTGKELDASALNSKTDWTVDSTGDIHKITITYPGDANYTFDVDYTDLATNKADDYAEDYFTVDKTAPTNLKVDYSTSVLDTVLESLTFGFYNAKMTVTLTAEDTTSEIHSFLYSYLNANGVSSVNAELVKQTISATDIKYSDDRKTATAIFEIPKMVLANDNQFNGTVEFTATDRAGNESRTHKETKRIVVDNIAPTATVQYNDATNVVGDISYYNGNINATITITEANFYANDVQVMVSKDGGTPSAVSVNWTNNSVDVHTGTFTLTEDGDYVVTINYRDKSSNAMATYTSKQMTIDTKIEAPTYSINGDTKSENGGAYKGDATIAFNFEDQNFENKEITLTRTRFNKVDEVKDELIKVSDKDKGGSGSFTIPAEVENDGIYVLKISMTDKAKHSVESQMKFTINRYGSVYEYSNYLASLIKDGGQYIKIEGNNSTAITQDLVITEYNANQILEDSLKILITRDGESIDAQYTSNPAVDSSANIGESGWYQYDYTIAKENFAEDGVYKITLASAYDTDDSENNDSASVPDNSIDEAENQILDAINFTVDTNKPEIRNIVNLDKAIVNAQTLNVKYTIVDVGGLKSIDVIVNGQKETITDFEEGGNAFNYTGEFTLNESSNAQTVQIVVTDLAGNVTDTASDEFKENHKDGAENGLYVFNDSITVSTNFFVRWYANKPLFWGSIGGVVVLTGFIWFLVAFKRKKKEEK